MRCWSHAVLIFALLMCAARIGISRAPDPGEYSAARYALQERRGVMVPMRDRVRLSVDIYSPVSSEKIPGILCLTPYDNAGLREKARWFATRGFTVVVADARGRYDSEGVFDPFDARHKTDGYDLVEWTAAQPSSNGKVGMIGGSYNGWTQWWTASAAPPHLAAIAPKVAPPDAFENVPYQNGVLTGSWFADWSAVMSGRTMQSIGTSAYGGWSTRRDDFRHTPYADINAYRGMESGPWVSEWYRYNRSSDAYWQAIAYQSEESYSRIRVPSLAFTGWFDANHPGTPMNYVGMKKFGGSAEARRPAMIIGPWPHDINQRVVAGIDYGPEATFDVDGYVVRWFDHFLKGLDNGLENDPPVHVFVMGENKWRAEQDWPLPSARPTQYFLVSGGRANSLHGDGALAASPPRAEKFDSYLYDPKNPTLDPFGSFPSSNGHIDGALDTNASASGNGVLVYQTSPLASPVRVIGPIEATLYAATSARDTDWMVRLVDVQPDGRSLLLTEGVMRARNRDPANGGRFNSAALSRIEPREIYQYTLRFWRGTANLFERGHRIRIEISSSWFPYFLPNLNTGADNLAAVRMSDAVVARQTVHHGPRHPSHVLLPIVPD